MLQGYSSTPFYFSVEHCGPEFSEPVHQTKIIVEREDGDEGLQVTLINVLKASS